MKSHRGLGLGILAALRKVGATLSGAAFELVADNGLVLAASIAFFTIFSLAPLLLLVVAVAGLAFGQDQTSAEIQAQFESLMGPQSAEFIAGVISRASKGASGVAAVISVGTLIFGATGVFVQLKAAVGNDKSALIDHTPAPDPIVLEANITGCGEHRPCGKRAD